MQVGKITLLASFHGVRSTVHILKSQYLCVYAATCCNLQVNPSTTHRQCPTPNSRGDTAASAAKLHPTALREHHPIPFLLFSTVFGVVLVTGTCLLKESCWELSPPGLQQEGLGTNGKVRTGSHLSPLHLPGHNRLKSAITSGPLSSKKMR